MGHKQILDSFPKEVACGDLKTCQDKTEVGLVTPADRIAPPVVHRLYPKPRGSSGLLGQNKD